MTVHTRGELKIDAHLQVNATQLLAPVRSGLAQVEQKMRTMESSVFAPLADAFVDLIGSGGKRLRPALSLLAAQIQQPESASPSTPSAASSMASTDMTPTAWDANIIALAASVEMLHTATLVHDDVIDGARLRRGAPTLNAVWNRGATVLAGNYMFARAAYFAAETENMRVIHIFSDTLDTIVDGELRQLYARHNFAQAKDEYYQRIYAKTASLFCAATEAAAVLAGYPETDVQRLHDYGYYLGMAFQIVDDILDFTGDDDTLGKPAGSDLRQGTLTLPFFYYLQHHADPDAVTGSLEAALAQAPPENDSHENDNSASRNNAWDTAVTRLVEEVRTGHAIVDARAEAEQFLHQARQSLYGFPNNSYKQAMLGLCDFVVQRTY
ncbi:MAG: polyprenyl synthetase family protein [Litorilinea sp.]